MNLWFRGIVMVAVGGLVLFVVTGCASREKRKVTVIEEQREGEVVEEDTGEMIVE